ncbi:MAG: hypothetical protein ACE5GC_07255 [Acidimicrobiia bacterium]
MSYATSTPSGTSCQTTEERWWLHSHQASWTLLDDFSILPNGALWADQHVVLGRTEAGPFLLDGALTVYAGDSSARRNVILGSDLRYLDPNGASDVLGVIASDEVCADALSPDSRTGTRYVLVSERTEMVGTARG